MSPACLLRLTPPAVSQACLLLSCPPQASSGCPPAQALCTHLCSPHYQPVVYGPPSLRPPPSKEMRGLLPEATTGLAKAMTPAAHGREHLCRSGHHLSACGRNLISCPLLPLRA